VPAVLTIALVACSGEESRTSSASASDFRRVGLQFTQALAARDYQRAYAMTAQEYRRTNTADQLRTAFETIVPTDWGAVGPIEVGQTMTSWPEKQPSDVGWVYVSIGGSVYSEAVTVVVMSENGEQKIREVQFGRP
jgi:hypothetical protein